jgi:hypothetical protein
VRLLEIERYLDDIENLIKEERLPSTTSKNIETENSSNIKQVWHYMYACSFSKAGYCLTG